MFRALIYLVLVAALAIGLAWFADRPGELSINWLSYQIDVPLFWVTVAAIIAAGLMLFIFSFISRIVSSPRRLRRHMKRRRIARGYTALRKGIFAVGAGDEATAARYAIEARRALPKEPLTDLLRAQSAQLSGDRRTAQRIFEAMADHSETRLLGLRGLFLEASREGQMEAARQFASRAMTLNPALPWPVHALFDMQCRSRNWQGALETLGVARNNRHLDRKTLDRRRAVLLTAQAQDLEPTEPGRASELAQEAHRIAPDFVPAAVIAGRIMAGQGNAYKAARILARTWQYTPHPDLALGYAYARPGDSPRDRLGRIKSLIVLTPDHPEARVALASAAVDAREWEEARDALQPLLSKNPTARICALMARIEGGEKRDAGRVREWLARAVRAPRDAVWIADGVASADWQPISPVTGALDAFEWRVPPDHAKLGQADPLFDDVTALGVELESVARKLADSTVKLDDAAGAAPAEPLTITVAPEPRAPKTAAPAPAEKKAEAKPAATPAPQKPATSAFIRETPPATPVTTLEKIEPAADLRPPPLRPTGTSVATTTEASAPQGKALTATPAPASASAAVPAPAAEAVRKAAPKIFVPDRPPDDPGPDPADLDETSTPYSRFRGSLKQPAN